MGEQPWGTEGWRSGRHARKGRERQRNPPWHPEIETAQAHKHHDKLQGSRPAKERR